jgi:hypothetical protein
MKQYRFDEFMEGQILWEFWWTIRMLWEVTYPKFNSRSYRNNWLKFNHGRAKGTTDKGSRLWICHLLRSFKMTWGACMPSFMNMNLSLFSFFELILDFLISEEQELRWFDYMKDVVLDEGKEGLTWGATARDDQSECFRQAANSLELEDNSCFEGWRAGTPAPRRRWWARLRRRRWGRQAPSSRRRGLEEA